MSVWRSANRGMTNKITKLPERLTAIETRIIDLETICSSQEFEREQKFKQLEFERANLKAEQ